MDHLPARLVRGHPLEEAPAPPQHADAHGAAGLVPREREEVAPEGGEVDRHVWHRLRPVHDDHRAGAVRRLAVTKGSVDGLLEISTGFWGTDGPQPLSDEWRRRILAEQRVTALAGEHALRNVHQVDAALCALEMSTALLDVWALGYAGGLGYQDDRVITELKGLMISYLAPFLDP